MNRYKQTPNVGEASRFSKSPMAEVEFSRMTATPTWLLPFNAGDIVPVYYAEVLPHDTISMDLEFIIRQNTVLRPTMGDVQVDFYAYFVPNRIINESWKNVQGENTSGFWTAPEVNLAPLYTGSSDVQIPVGSIADYYGLPTQAPIKAYHLQRMNDLKARGYLSIYNEYFRDQNYQNPIPFSKLNIYEGFLEPAFSSIPVDTSASAVGARQITANQPANGSYPDGAIIKAIYGEGQNQRDTSTALNNNGITVIPARVSTFSFLDKPLKANKLHDAFTSVLPSPQKGPEVYLSAGGNAPVSFDTSDEITRFASSLQLAFNMDAQVIGKQLLYTGDMDLNTRGRNVLMSSQNAPSGTSNETFVNGFNLKASADLSEATGVSINELRTAIATQQVYETLARGGSRYTSMLRNFFELDIESPFMDIPLELGHIRRTLDLFQVAQTSASVEGGSPQGSLTAFGFTTKGGHLFTRTFLEHGYIHIFAVVRQKNVYSTYLAPDNFRMSTLDFYLPQFANIGEQPIRTATLNPFIESTEDDAIGFQEAWWEYRYEPDRVHGLFRTGVDGSLAVWNYADEYDPNFEFVDGNWLKSNAEEVLNRTLAVTSELAPQFKGLFAYKVDKNRPMPTYSIPGLDTI